jgi:hypothetical protein
LPNPTHTTEGEISPRRRTFLDKVLSGHNWRGLAALLQTAQTPVMVIWRYYFKGGSYPYTIGLRTPIGVIDLELYCTEDLITIYEVFFRKDYCLPRNARIVVDFGSNIGISAAYFVTRNAKLKVYAYEPVSLNISRAKRNLAPLPDRVELAECAVGTTVASASAWKAAAATEGSPCAASPMVTGALSSPISRCRAGALKTS